MRRSRLAERALSAMSAILFTPDVQKLARPSLSAHYVTTAPNVSMILGQVIWYDKYEYRQKEACCGEHDQGGNYTGPGSAPPG